MLYLSIKNWNFHFQSHCSNLFGKIDLRFVSHAHTQITPINYSIERIHILCMKNFNENMRLSISKGSSFNVYVSTRSKREVKFVMKRKRNLYKLERFRDRFRFYLQVRSLTLNLACFFLLLDSLDVSCDRRPLPQKFSTSSRSVSLNYRPLCRGFYGCPGNKICLNYIKLYSERNKLYF